MEVQPEGSNRKVVCKELEGMVGEIDPPRQRD